MFKIFLFLLLFPCLVNAKTLKIVIIDSGLDNLTGVKLCGLDANMDFTSTGTKSEFNGHGNNITHIITDGLESYDYCIYHIKVFTAAHNTVGDTRAFAEAILLGADIINYSAGGADSNIYEEAIISLAAAKGIKIFVAAGNEGHNLNSSCDYFPACYNTKGLVIVGNKHKTSNYGDKVTLIRNGVNVKASGTVMTGSSQATAIATHEEALKRLKGNK